MILGSNEEKDQRTCHMHLFSEAKKDLTTSHLWEEALSCKKVDS